MRNTYAFKNNFLFAVCSNYIDSIGVRVENRNHGEYSPVPLYPVLNISPQMYRVVQ